MSGREVSWRERIISAGADPAPLHPEVFRFMSVFVFLSVFVSVFVHSSVFVSLIIVLSLCVCMLPDQNISGGPTCQLPGHRPFLIHGNLKLTVVVVFRINLCLYFCLNWFVFVFWGGSIGSMLGSGTKCILLWSWQLHLHLLHPTLSTPLSTSVCASCTSNLIHPSISPTLNFMYISNDNQKMVC